MIIKRISMTLALTECIELICFQ